MYTFDLSKLDNFKLEWLLQARIGAYKLHLSIEYFISMHNFCKEFINHKDYESRKKVSRYFSGVTKIIHWTVLQILPNTFNPKALFIYNTLAIKHFNASGESCSKQFKNDMTNSSSKNTSFSNWHP